MRDVRQQRNLIPAADFANEDLRAIYEDLVLSSVSFQNAIHDVSLENCRTVLYMDFSNGYPMLTPRDNAMPNPSRGSHDFFCSKVLERVGLYNSKTTNFIIADSPLFYIELFDQIQHRLDYANRVLNAKGDDALQGALLSEMRRIPTKKDEIEAAIDHRIANLKGKMLADRLTIFRDNIHSGAIRRIFDFYDSESYYDSLRNQHIFENIYRDINKFRRPSSSSDPDDIEFHKLIDVYMVMSTLDLRRMRNDYNLCYWGQDRLRKIFCDRQEEVSRDAVTPHIIVQSLLETPHDRVLKCEATYNIRHRSAELNWLVEELGKMKGEKKIPITLAKSILNCRVELDQFLFGSSDTVTPDEYNSLVRQISSRPGRVREAYERFAHDAKSAEEIVKEISGDLLNKEAREFLSLRPNERVRQLLFAMDK